MRWILAWAALLALLSFAVAFMVTPARGCGWKDCAGACSLERGIHCPGDCICQDHDLDGWGSCI